MDIICYANTIKNENANTNETDSGIRTFITINCQCIFQRKTIWSKTVCNVFSTLVSQLKLTTLTTQNMFKITILKTIKLVREAPII